MCVGVPGKILEIKDNRGIIEFAGVKREVFMQLVPEARVGEYVLVHAGCAMEVLDEEEANKTIALLEELNI